MRSKFDKMSDDFMDYYKKLASMPNMTSPCAELPLHDQTECKLSISKELFDEVQSEFKAKRDNPPTNYGKW